MSSSGGGDDERRDDDGALGQGLPGGGEDEISLAPEDDAGIVLEPDTISLDGGGTDALDAGGEGEISLAPEPEAPVVAAAAPAAARAATSPAPPPAARATLPAIIMDKPGAADAPAPARSARAEYNTDLPSIGGDRVREPIVVPKARGPAGPAASSASRPSARAIAAVAGLALAGAGLLGYQRLNRAAPVVDSVTPSKVEPGQTVTVAGSGFGTNAARLTVRFGDRPAVASSASDTQLAVTVPAELAPDKTLDVQVTVEGPGGRSNALFVKLARFPRVTALEPDVALPGAEITLRGQNLGAESVVVTVAGTAAEILDRDASSVRIRVPALKGVVEGRTADVVVQAGGDTARAAALWLGRLPLVASLAPASGPAGERVTVKGRGFDAQADQNRVTFGGEPALVIAATDRELRVAVPPSTSMKSQSTVPVSVAVRGTAAAATPAFIIVRASGSSFRPTFAAAPAPGGDGRSAVVASELGPVLLLTGRGDAASTAERAVAVAARLNRVMQSALAGPVAFEVEDGATPAVVAAGGTVVTATPEDTQGYGRNWEPGVRAPHVAPRGLAAFWAALLHDYVGLFAQRTRPTRAAELTPRARVLLDAERRGGAGVALSVVSPLSPERARALRELAFGAGGADSATGGIALLGAWEGTIEEGGVPRAVQIQVAAEGPRLTGTMSARSGKVSMGTPLQELRYDRGEVTFTVATGGAPKHFRGRIDGAVLSGTIHRDARAPDAIGRFSFRHIG